MIPYTDHECRLALDELYRGDKVVLPASIEHARFMSRVAQMYIDQHHNDLIDLIKNSDGKNEANARN